MSKRILKFVKLRENVLVPKKATSGSAGFDLHACLENDVSISFGGLVKIPCGIAVEIPEDYVGLIFARSGLGIKYGIMPSNGVGVIDSDYRGEIHVGLCKTFDGPEYIIKNEDRIAQLIIIKAKDFEIQETEDLSVTERDDKGFGSSGR
ncbi:MAG: dUTP diphosphatase [Candidatus Improbicoccus pseudotrichonymphae]|uniref:dUTP diphosphatase n=1 Tax=Candidatus Improbicoccus pseudotrichonymphae TaxID=3033792 RepID=A0AA48L120_9FIRM|nr:MAG: dUTP diphosphatase [Candidatus Improbicoccus pseudotrichonymphae]